MLRTRQRTVSSVVLAASAGLCRQGAIQHLHAQWSSIENAPKIRPTVQTAGGAPFGSHWAKMRGDYGSCPRQWFTSGLSGHRDFG